MGKGVGRFQVMATLQAARARVLGLPLATAKSWGLNRAIYYAAAKREFFLGDDKAYQVTTRGRKLFTIGGEIQSPEDFRRQIEQRFAGTFRATWGDGHGATNWPRNGLNAPALRDPRKS